MDRDWFWFGKTYYSELARDGLAGCKLPESPHPVTAKVLNSLTSHRETKEIKAEAAGSASVDERIPLGSSRAE